MVVRVPNVKSLSFFKSLSFWVFLKKNLPPFFENQIVEFLDDTGVYYNTRTGIILIASAKKLLLIIDKLASS